MIIDSTILKGPYFRRSTGPNQVSYDQLPPVGFKPQKTSETSKSQPRVFINKKKQQVYKIFNTEEHERSRRPHRQVPGDYLSFNNELTCLTLLKENFIESLIAI